MVTNREDAILAATKVLRWRKNKFFFSTLDGVYIAGHRFYELYHQYNMRGIEFIPFVKSAGYFVCRFINTVHFDMEMANQVHGVLNNGICPVCGRSRGYHYP